MTDKRCTEEDVVAQLSDGMTIAIGGWGSRRKPMSMVRAIARSNLKDLTIVSYGGPDVGLLCATGQAAKVIYAFVSLDTIPLEPHFRAARQSGAVQDVPMDEGMFLLALQAAAWRVPFLPTRVGLGSDLFRDNPSLSTIEFEGETLVAVKAMELDAVLIHQNRGDERGNGQFLGPDLYFDDLMVQAAPTGRRFMSVERILDTAAMAKEGTHHTRRISRMSIDGVIEAPNGAHFTSCDPDYGRDEAFQKEYAAAAKTPEAFAEFKANWVDLSEAEYQQKLRSRS